MRKINEIRIARDVENKYSKSDILENYLNVLYFGNNVYGIGSAAKYFFDKNVSELTLSESALLAGVINNPSLFSPVNHLDNALKRRKVVLNRMREQNLISSDEYEQAVTETPEIQCKTKTNSFYENAVINEACKRLSLTKKELFAGNYTVCTYFDKPLTEKINEIIENFSRENAFIEVTVLKNDGGSIVAKCSDKKNYFSEIKRQPGSTVKPILCYAPALEKKLVYPITPILDEETSFSGYVPKNYDGKYHGWVSVKDSISQSLNVPAVKLLNMNGVEFSKSVAEKCGMSFTTDDKSLALALGGTATGMTLSEIAESYSTLAREGIHVDSACVSTIFDKNGKCVYCNSVKAERALSEDSAFLVTDALISCATEGTAKRVDSQKSGRIAAKTGTVGTKSGNTDAYCVAYSKNFTVAVRISAEKNILLPNEISGGTTPSTIVKKIFENLSLGEKFTAPTSVVSLPVKLDVYKRDKKIIPADNNSTGRDVFYTFFSRNNLPFEPIRRATESELDDFDNFNVVDGFFD